MNQAEIIFVQTDPAFDIVLKSLTELSNQNRLRVTHIQAANLTDIESNDDNEVRRFMFGGERKAYANTAFGLTASAVVRMCMLEAAGVPRRLWPAIGPDADRRNRAKLQNPFEDQPRLFSLANNRNTARHYWSKYDQLYPHFRIEDEVRQVALNEQVSMPRMMLIFRENFTEVVEITTTFTATPREEQQFSSYIHVICIVRKISKPSEEGEDGKFTRRLKELKVPVEIHGEYFEEMTKVNAKTDLQQLGDAFAKLKVGDNNE
ncbi:uncharacterized protein [Montipora foliosa]|uniref:uncharacterized protein n=1 Tax=Montipora foliosa TaxID=591990 RepID=UPI0035F1DFB7